LIMKEIFLLGIS